VDFDYDERESRPREILRLVSAVNSPPSEPGDRRTPEPAVQCHTVLVEILGAIDRGQATQALELFTPDASLEADGKQLHGRDEIASFLAEAQRQDRHTAHLITNEVVRRATDDEIELTALTFHYKPQADGKYRLEGVLDTTQAFRRTPDGWRIHRRTSTPLHPLPPPTGG